MAKPQAGSRNRVEYVENEPATGSSTAISPRACTVQYNIIPITLYAIKSEAGPPVERALPDATKRPVPSHTFSLGFIHIYTILERGGHLPIDPPIAIICKCRPLSCLANGEFAVASAAASSSKPLPLAPATPRGVARRFGSLLKLSQILTGRLALYGRSSP